MAEVAAPTKHKIIEIVVDPPNTIIRRVVPATTQEGDIPKGARLLSVEETSGRLARTAEPEVVRAGDPVKLIADPMQVGSVFAELKSGDFQVHFADGTKGRFAAKDLMKAY